MELSAAWSAVEAATSALVSGSLGTESIARLKGAATSLLNDGFGSIAISYVLDIVERHFAATLIPRFLAEFASFAEWRRTLDTNSLEEKVEGTLYQQSHALYLHFKFASMLMDELFNDQDANQRNLLVQQFRLSCLSTLSDPPTSFQHALFCYFARQFRLYRDAHHNSQANTLSDGDAGENTWDAERFSAVCLQLKTLDILKLADDVLTEVLFDHIESHLQENYSENFEQSCIKEIVSWAGKVPLGWLQIVFGNATLTPQYQQLTLRIEFFVFEAFCSLRIAKMFDILIDFPQSTPALEDLKECLHRTHQHEELITELKKSFTQRLLHPGAASSMIIDQYISVIKALRIIDPSGRTLDEVAVPIRAYLSRREDAIRCIVASLTDDTNSELFEELQGGEEPVEGVNDDDEDKDADLNWTPAVLDDHAAPDQPMGPPRKIDIIGMLVSIYGTKELFVNEYKSMLAERLLNILDYNTEKEIRILELLKLRFGEGSMEQCEIMLRDMADSKRADTFIHQHIETANESPLISIANFNTTIVSPLFWPAFRQETLVLHPAVQQVCDQYKSAYEKLKASRKLNWKAHVGTVELELQRANGQPWTVSVTPMQATLAMHFQDRSEWSLAELADKMRVSADIVKRRLRFWINNGLLCALPNSIYRVATESDASTTQAPIDNDEEMQSNTASASDELWDKVKTIVLGMLANFADGLSAEQIHRNLGFFVADDFPFHKTVPELNAYLVKLVREEPTLEFTAGLFKLSST